MYIIRFTREYIFAIINDRISSLVKKTLFLSVGHIFLVILPLVLPSLFDQISLNFLFANILINTEFSYLPEYQPEVVKKWPHKRTSSLLFSVNSLFQ